MISKAIFLFCCLLVMLPICGNNVADYPKVSENAQTDWFPLSEAIGVSPWYCWADVTPQHKKAIYVEPVTFVQGEPSVQYRGIFINDERFGGWARWAELKHGKVGQRLTSKSLSCCCA